MNITLFGGTGLTGQLIIPKALNKGHQVFVYARNPSKISLKHENLHLIQGSLDNYASIEEIVKKTDVVISLLGPMEARIKGLPIVEGTQNIVKAMQQNNIQRLIAISTPSYKDNNDRFSFSFNSTIFLVKTLGSGAYQNVVGSAEVISKSGLEWTIVRPPLISNKPGRGKIITGYIGEKQIKLFSLTREDLTDFILDQIEDKKFIKKAPVICN